MSRIAGAPGSKRQVQGYNGLNAAQPVCPWGSTRTFQLKAGVSWELGLRRGVAVHSRGRHLREGRILRSHGKDTARVREQQPPHQLQHYDQGPNKVGKNFKEFGRVRNVTKGQDDKDSRLKKGIVSSHRSQYKRIHRELCGDRSEVDKDAQNWRLNW